MRNWSPRVAPSHPHYSGEPDLIDLNDPALAGSASAAAPTYAQVVDGDTGSAGGVASNKARKEKRRPASSKRPGSVRDRKRDRERESKNGNGNGNGATSDMDNMDSEDEWEEEEWVPDVFLFEYGTVVLWGMTEREEKAFLKQLYVLGSLGLAVVWEMSRWAEGAGRAWCGGDVCLRCLAGARGHCASVASGRRPQMERHPYWMLS